MSDAGGPRYTINSLPDFRFELRRNGLVMGFYGSYEQAQLAIQQIDAEVAHSGWPTPPSPNPMALEAKALEAAKLERLLRKWAVTVENETLDGRLPGNEAVNELWLVALDAADFLAALPLPAAGEGLEPVANTDPHPRWTANDGSERHPQTVEQWDWRTDPISEPPGLLSTKRLHVASDFDDPRAPDQMALVLRIDLIRVLGELTWRRAQVEMFNGRAATPAARTAVLEDEVAIDRSLLEAACRELRKWKVERGGDDQVVLNLEAALKEKT